MFRTAIALAGVAAALGVSTAWAEGSTGSSSAASSTSTSTGTTATTTTATTTTPTTTTPTTTTPTTTTPTTTTPTTTTPTTTTGAGAPASSGAVLSGTVSAIDPTAETASITFYDENGNQQTVTLDLSAATIRLMSPDGTSWSLGTTASLDPNDNVTVDLDVDWDAVTAAESSGAVLATAELDDSGAPVCVGGGPIVMRGTAGSSTAGSATTGSSQTVTTGPIVVDPRMCPMSFSAAGSTNAVHARPRRHHKSRHPSHAHRHASQHGKAKGARSARH
jgi:hypothetical protein